jgi:hypothetical protein
MEDLHCNIPQQLNHPQDNMGPTFMDWSTINEDLHHCNIPQERQLRVPTRWDRKSPKVINWATAQNFACQLHMKCWVMAWFHTILYAFG